MNTSLEGAPGNYSISGRRRQSLSDIPTFIGPLVRSRHTRPCPTYFEISFLENTEARIEIDETRPRRLRAITFRNFYCSHISIKQRQDQPTDIRAATSGGGVRGVVDRDPWVAILSDRALMEDPHFEDDAQDWHVVTVDEFDLELYDANSAAPLRVYLNQPSPIWKSIGLQHVKCVSYSGSHEDESMCGKSEGDDGHGGTGATSDSFSADRWSSNSHPPYHGEGSLGELCSGISEQVRIFRDDGRTGRTL